MQYTSHVIKSFKSRDTERLFGRCFVKRYSGIERAARISLAVLDAAENLYDLRVPPSNRLEALKGGLKGRHSIRINRQWRICFVWRGNDDHDVEIIDYH